MKIIQSFWTRPMLEFSDHENDRFNAGWHSQRTAVYSFALSCLSLKKQYGSVTLYTDLYGQRFFGEFLELPYDEINPLLEKACHNVHSKLWAFGKLAACAEQKEPFLHVDNDVFVWDKMGFDRENYELIAQNLEIGFPHYEKAFEFVRRRFEYVPEVLMDAYQDEQKIIAHNAGVIGGIDMSFFAELLEEARRFIFRNVEYFNGLDLGTFNALFEQQLGYAVARQQGLTTQYLFDHISTDFREVLNFASVPLSTHYIHAVGFAKKSLVAEEQIEARLAYEYPGVYHQLNHKLLEKDDSAIVGSRISADRLSYLFECYQLLDESSIGDILHLPMKLADTTTIVRKEGKVFLRYYFVQGKTYFEPEIAGLGYILLFFEEWKTPYELISELILDKDFINSYSSEDRLKEDILSFVMEHLVILQILQVKS